MSTEKNKYNISYYTRRHDFVLITSTIIFIYTFIYLLLLNNVTKVVLTESSGWVNIFLPQNNLVIIAVLWVLILAISFLGSREQELEVFEYLVLYRPNIRASQVMLTISTIAFILLLSLPIIFTGGSLQSVYTTMLVTMCSLTAIIVKDTYLRILFIVLTMGVLVIGSFFYIPIEITDPGKYRLYYLSSIFVSLFIAFLLSWQGKPIVFPTNGEGLDNK